MAAVRGTSKFQIPNFEIDKIIIIIKKRNGQIEFVKRLPNDRLLQKRKLLPYSFRNTRAPFEISALGSKSPCSVRNRRAPFVLTLGLTVFEISVLDSSLRLTLELRRALLRSVLRRGELNWCKGLIKRLLQLLWQD
ncbi:hypothetical protein IC575_013716 [Cucumis melo]